MIDNPEQVERLLAKLQAALPVPAQLTPETAAPRVRTTVSGASIVKVAPIRKGMQTTLRSGFIRATRPLTPGKT